MLFVLLRVDLWICLVVELRWRLDFLRMTVIGSLCLSVRTAVKCDSDCLPVVGLEFELPSSAEHGHEFFDELLVFFHPNIIMFANRFKFMGINCNNRIEYRSNDDLLVAHFHTLLVCILKNVRIAISFSSSCLRCICRSAFTRLLFYRHSS